MKFKLLINPKKDEFVQAQVHQENDFTKELKDFVLTNGNSNKLLVYDDKDAIALSLDHNAQWIVTKSGNLGGANTLIDILKYFDSHGGLVNE